MKSDDDLIELECLRAVQATGAFPDGCELAVYVRGGYVESTAKVLRLTSAGARRLAALASSSAREA